MTTQDPFDGSEHEPVEAEQHGAAEWDSAGRSLLHGYGTVSGVDKVNEGPDPDSTVTMSAVTMPKEQMVVAIEQRLGPWQHLDDQQQSTLLERLATIEDSQAMISMRFPKVPSVDEATTPPVDDAPDGDDAITWSIYEEMKDQDIVSGIGAEPTLDTAVDPRTIDPDPIDDTGLEATESDAGESTTGATITTIQKAELHMAKDPESTDLEKLGGDPALVDDITSSVVEVDQQHRDADGIDDPESTVASPSLAYEKVSIWRNQLTDEPLEDLSADPESTVASSSFAYEKLSITHDRLTDEPLEDLSADPALRDDTVPPADDTPDTDERSLKFNDIVVLDVRDDPGLTDDVVVPMMESSAGSGTSAASEDLEIMFPDPPYAPVSRSPISSQGATDPDPEPTELEELDGDPALRDDITSSYTETDYKTGLPDRTSSTEPEPADGSDIAVETPTLVEPQLVDPQPVESQLDEVQVDLSVDAEPASGLLAVAPEPMEIVDDGTDALDVDG